MKRKKFQSDRFHPDKFRDGPKKTPARTARSTWDDENLDEAFDEWIDMRSWSENGDEEE